MVACLFKSNLVMNVILDYGGADIYAINTKKISAYQVAFNTNN